MVNVKISGLFRCCIQQYRVIKKAKSITKDKVDRCGSPINCNLSGCFHASFEARDLSPASCHQAVNVRWD